jgi:hypothetical protein
VILRAGLIASLMLTLATPAAAECAKPEELAMVRGEHAFTQTRTLKGVARPLISSGTLEAQADGVVWKVTKPIEIVTRIGPKGVTQSIDGGPEEAVGAAGANNPFFSETGLIDLLRGDLSKLDQRYQVARGTRAKPEGWKLALTPKSASVTPYISNIAIEGCTRVESVAVAQANGDMMRIELKASQ